jgi:hypothetical protein
MRLSELHKFSVSVISVNLFNEEVLVRCNLCGSQWDITMTQKANIRNEGWKCPMCYLKKDPDSFKRLDEEWERIKEEAK